MPRVERISAFLRFELADARRSRWALFTTLAYGGVFGLFVWFGLRESTVLGFTGLSRVVLNLSNAVVLVVPLVALVATSQSVIRARAGGSFELLLATPNCEPARLWALPLEPLFELCGAD